MEKLVLLVVKDQLVKLDQQGLKVFLELLASKAFGEIQVHWDQRGQWGLLGLLEQLGRRDHLDRAETLVRLGLLAYQEPQAHKVPRDLPATLGQ